MQCNTSLTLNWVWVDSQSVSELSVSESEFSLSLSQVSVLVPVESQSSLSLELSLSLSQVSAWVEPQPQPQSSLSLSLSQVSVWVWVKSQSESKLILSLGLARYPASYLAIHLVIYILSWNKSTHRAMRHNDSKHSLFFFFASHNEQNPCQIVKYDSNLTIGTEIPIKQIGLKLIWKKKTPRMSRPDGHRASSIT